METLRYGIQLLRPHSNRRDRLRPPGPHFLVLSLIVLFCGCHLAAAPERAGQLPGDQIVDHGYAILFALLGDEKDVAKLRIIKREREELKNLIKEISRVSGEAHKKLTDFGRADGKLNLREQGLPVAEVETRKAISKTKEKALLARKGKEFELELLLDQNEALTYGAHLARVVSGHESDPVRGEFLRQLSQDLGQLQEKLRRMLSANYSGTQ